jgi:parallel beta-helix repeat protein
MQVFVCAVVASGALAGELTPPPGPVSPTMKPLDEIEPRIAVNSLLTGVDSVHVIDQSGSYYLTANILGQAGKHCVQIESDNVTLDLNGFALEGVAGSEHGVNALSVEGLTIRNGTISGFQMRGIEASTTKSSVFDSLIVRDNSDKGIAAGFDSVVRDCISTGNGSDGIFTNTGSLIQSCIANANSGDGFDISVGCSVIDCVADDNSGSGYFIIQHVNVDRCIARGNGQHGLVSGAGTSVLNSHFRRNSDHGIRVTDGCTIANNRCDQNVGPGIRVSASCSVKGNECGGNGFFTGDAAGILVEGSNSTIHANTTTGNDRGLEVTAVDNIVTSNVSVANGTNYVIVIGNDVAPISTAATAVSPLANIED